jgi:hypothetical protein
MKTLFALILLVSSCAFTLRAEASNTCVKQEFNYFRCQESRTDAGQYEWSVTPYGLGYLRGPYVGTQQPWQNTFVCNYVPPAYVGNTEVQNIQTGSVNVVMPLIGMFPVESRAAVDCRSYPEVRYVVIYNPVDWRSCPTWTASYMPSQCYSYYGGPGGGWYDNW